METLNFFEKTNNCIKQLEEKTHSLLTEINYLKLSNWDKNEKNILNSSGILLTRLSDLTDQVQKVLSLNADILKEIKFPKDALIVIRKQIDESNTRIIKLSNALTNLSYFIKQNMIE